MTEEKILKTIIGKTVAKAEFVDDDYMLAITFVDGAKIEIETMFRGLVRMTKCEFERMKDVKQNGANREQQS